MIKTTRGPSQKPKAVLTKTLPFPQIDQIDLDHDKQSVKGASKYMKGTTWADLRNGRKK